MLKIKNNIEIDRITDKIKFDLTVANPIFNKRIEMNLPNWDVPKQFIYYNKTATGFTLPIGYLHKLSFNSIIDDRFENTSYNNYFSKLKFIGKLRSYQEDIVNACVNNTMGVIEAMTGSGKTICFVALTIERKQPTLILVNTIELANQTIDSFKQFTNIKDIGFIGNGKFELKPITVGLHQTLTRLDQTKWDQLNNLFSQVIADETHIIAAQTFYKNMNTFNAKYKFGFSATPHREDGLTPVIHFAVGPTIFSVPKEELEDVLIKPEIKTINTNYFFPLLETSEYQLMITDMALNKTRNDFIVTTLQNDYKDNYVCLLCNRTEQVYILEKLLGDKAVGITSQDSKKDRKQIMEDLKNKRKQYVISTYGLFSQGIDIPHLDVLFLCSPIKSEIKLKQAAGRLMRMSDGKTKAIIIDFIDHEIEFLRYSARRRQTIYRKI